MNVLNTAQHKYQITSTQKKQALQRLTAMWAFAESGLGGVLHALQVPFTGLVVGGFAIIIITLIAKFSENNIDEIIKSLMIVLLVKLTISPYTPFPAYIAVSFQAIMGFLIFSLIRINFVSILLLSVIAMLESAIQKILVLTLFFGESIYKATNALTNFITEQIGIQNINGSFWLIAIYILIYIIGGIMIAVFTFNIFKAISENETIDGIEFKLNENKYKGSNKSTRITFLFVILFIITIVLYFSNSSSTNRFWLIFKSITYTCFIIIIWYQWITPLFSKLMMKFLKKTESKYEKELKATLLVLPYLKQIATLAWLKSKEYNGVKRIQYFLSYFLKWSLSFSKNQKLSNT